MAYSYKPVGQPETPQYLGYFRKFIFKSFFFFYSKLKNIYIQRNKTRKGMVAYFSLA